MPKHNSHVSVILVAGGSGSRMQSPTPKQFLPLNNKLVALHSYERFLKLPLVHQIVVVCAPQYRSLFPASSHIPLTFALPGERRQDSVYNGLQAVDPHCSFVCVHDSARPCITLPLIQRVLDAAYIHGAATVGMPVKFTVKQCNAEQLVTTTPDRAYVWEIQTPQVIRKDLLQQGFAAAQRDAVTVTDDVSLVERLGIPVKLVEGSYTNLKITTPEDLPVAAHFISQLG